MGVHFGFAVASTRAERLRAAISDASATSRWVRPAMRSSSPPHGSDRMIWLTDVASRVLADRFGGFGDGFLNGFSADRKKLIDRDRFVKAVSFERGAQNTKIGQQIG